MWEEGMFIVGGSWRGLSPLLDGQGGSGKITHGSWRWETGRIEKERFASQYRFGNA